MSNDQKTVLLLNSSPRKNGLTNALLTACQEKLDALNSNEEKKIVSKSIQLSDFNIQHCTGCDACLKKPFACPLSEKDDMPKLEKELLSASAIIVGAPSYFANVPAIMKDVIDRSRPMKMAKYKLKDKIFSAITASGLQNGGSNFVADTLIHWAIIQGMIVVGALGHPVLMNNLPSESLQKLELTSFRKPSEPSDLAKGLSESLAKRVFGLL
ncbi:MAG: hypothetical protein GF364_11920 [Candidatus Lokiarchaeota archaeon]|nr:hypothetical protein [Candidatus Lokiarchaeota archaeon]